MASWHRGLVFYFFPRGSHVGVFPKAHQEGLARECELEHHCQFGWGNGVIRVQRKYLFLYMSRTHVTHVTCFCWGMDLPFYGSNLPKKRVIWVLGTHIYIYLFIPNKMQSHVLFVIVAKSWLANTIEVVFSPKGTLKQPLREEEFGTFPSMEEKLHQLTDDGHPAIPCFLRKVWYIKRWVAGFLNHQHYAPPNGLRL